MMDPADLRHKLVRAISGVPGPRVAVYLSGGFDSWSLVFAARAAGKEVAGYVFHLVEREPVDLRLARENSRIAGVELTVLPIAWTIPEALISDITVLKHTFGCRSKTEIECVWPFYRTAKLVAESEVLVGHEDMYGCTKRAAMHFRENLDAWRVEARHHAANQNAALSQLFGSLGKRLWMPYEDPGVRQVFAGANWDDLHKPSVKQPTLDAFPEFAGIEVIRQGLQVGDSGIREAFGALLATPYNVTKARSVTAIYNRI